MRVFLTADAHFFEWREYASVVAGVNTRLRAITDALIHSIGEAVNEHGCDTMMFLGDLTHSRASLTHPVVSEVRRFGEYARSMFKHVVAIRGNHDVYLKSPHIDSVSLFQGGSNVSVFGSPRGDRNSVFGFIPWMAEKDDFRRELDYFREKKVEYVFGHFGVLGSKVGDGWVVQKAEVGLEDLEGFKGVFLGHYHNHQRLKGNVWYVGSPVPHTWSEEAQEKVYGVLDTETGKVSWHIIPGPSFRKLDLGSDSLDAALGTTNPDAFLKVRVNPDDKKQIRALEKLRAERPNLKVEFEREIKESTARIDVGNSYKDAVAAYIKERPPQESLDRKTIVETACALLSDKDASGHTRSSSIRIKRLRLRHFMSFDHLAFDFENRGLICISGANGAGKSALLESILWCLYGKTIRYGSATSNLVNRFVDQPYTRVEVVLDVDGQDVVIQRFAKTKEQDAKILIGGHQFNYDDGQAHIEAYLPPYNVFVNTVFFSSSISRFTEATDAEKKAVIENILGLTMYREAEETAKSRVSGAKVDADLASSTHARTAGSVVALKEAIEAHKGKKPVLSPQHEKEFESAKAEVDRVKADVEKAARAVEKADKTRDALAESVLASDAEKAEELDETATRLLADLRVARERQVEIRTSRKIASEFVSKLRSTRGACPTCKQPVSADYVKKAEALAAKAAAESETQLAQFDDVARDLEDQIARVTEQQKSLGRINDNPKYKKASEQCELADSRLNTAKDLLDTAEDRLSAAKETVDRYKVAFDSWQKHGRALSSQRDGAIAAAEKAAKEMQGALARVELYTYVAQMFSAGGLRSFILDTCEADINTEIRQVSRILTGGAIDVQFSATSTTKGGNVRDRVSIVAVNENGSEVYPGNSKGERARIDLCVLLGVRRLALRQSAVRCGTLFMDEVFDGVDPNGAQAVVQLLQEEAATGSTIPLVSHDPNIVGMIADVVTVVKCGNTSGLEVSHGQVGDEGTPEPEPRKAKRRSRARG